MSLFLLIVPLFLSARQEPGSFNPVSFEKTYLHTDRDVYLPGDDIWFKAYLLGAQTNRPTNNSNNLYAELISPAAKIISRAMIRMDEGLGKGDFKLRDTAAPGVYRIRAYTNWMRNFGDNFVFEKNIRVLPLGAAGPPVAGTAASKTPAPETGTPPLSPPTLQFFPEGGALVAGVVALVGVKAEDGYGRGMPVTGEVLGPSGEPVARFTCDSLGMGAFTLWPAAGGYRASVALEGNKQLFPLPPVAEKGFAMAVRIVDNVINVALNCNEATLAAAAGKQLLILARHTGKTYFSQKVELKETGTLFRVPLAGLPGGIACITVLDSAGNPLCERLVYVQQANRDGMTVLADKQVYQPKERATVTISLGSEEKASLSMAVVDADVVPVQQEDIVSYLNLRSEIRGRIERPRRYFDTTNVNRFTQLDLLLLTQGWRGFIWKKITEAPLKPAYLPGRGIDITGKVRKVGSKTPMPGLNITLYAPQATGQKLFAATTDEEGRFAIPGAVFYGYQYLNFTSRSSAGIRKDGNSKGFSGGWVQVDSLERDTLPVAWRPDLSLLPDFRDVLENQQRKFSFTGVNRLQEVALATRKYTFTPERFAITQAEQKDFVTLRHYLLYTIPGAFMKMTENGGSYLMCNSAPNTSIAIGTELLSLPMDKVLSVTLQKYVIMKAIPFEDFGALSYRVTVKLRPGALNVKNYFDNTVADMAGYYRSRVFYSPKFEGPDEKPDRRGNTIYWEPDIATDENGVASASFTNKDLKGKVRLVVQGITGKGVPVAAMASYEVK